MMVNNMGSVCPWIRKPCITVNPGVFIVVNLFLHTIFLAGYVNEVLKHFQI